MPTLEFIDYVPHRAVVNGNTVSWVRDKAIKPINGLPQLFWSDGTPWREANLWARERATPREIKLKTVQDAMRHLHKYAAWLEETEQDWKHFPLEKAKRVLVRWRGELIAQRGDGRLSPSTARERMASTIRFYRFAWVAGFIDKRSPIWQDKQVVLRYFDTVGLERTMGRINADVSIPNVARHGTILEDGLTPLSDKHKIELLTFARDNCSPEINLMLALGFWTGARIGTITDLKVANLVGARQDPMMPGIYLVRCGPGSQPYVRTKFDVKGELLLPAELREDLLFYGFDQRRKKRQAQAAPEHRDLLFLTRFGAPYAEREAYTSPSINQEMRSLRKAALATGLHFMERFQFHDTRATFGTWLMTLCLNEGSVNAALEFVRLAMFHKEVSTTLRYIKFIEENKNKAKYSDAFSRVFIGLRGRLNTQGVTQKVTAHA